MTWCINSFFFSSRRRHTRCYRDWSSDVCSSDLKTAPGRRSPSPSSPLESHLRAPPGTACRQRGSPRTYACLRLKYRKKVSTNPVRTPTQPVALSFLQFAALLAVFSAAALQQPGRASPERVGEYRQTQLF